MSASVELRKRDTEVQGSHLRIRRLRPPDRGSHAGAIGVRIVFARVYLCERDERTRFKQTTRTLYVVCDRARDLAMRPLACNNRFRQVCSRFHQVSGVRMCGIGCRSMPRIYLSCCTCDCSGRTSR